MAVSPRSRRSQRHLRRARRFRGGGVVAAGLLSALWLFAALWHTAYTHYGSWSAGLVRGAVVVERFTPPLSPGRRLGGKPVDRPRAVCSWSPPGGGVFWWPSWSASAPPVPMTRVIVPLWLPVLAAAGVVGLTHRSVRAAELAGCCQRCRYSRAGLAAEAVCPECGASSRRGEGASPAAPPGNGQGRT